jgi:hypothetical protein
MLVVCHQWRAWSNRSIFSAFNLALYRRDNASAIHYCTGKNKLSLQADKITETCFIGCLICGLLYLVTIHCNSVAEQ